MSQHLREVWARQIEAAAGCSNCGQTDPDDRVWGSDGCETCGGNLPYRGRPSKQHSGHIDIDERIPYWASKDPDDAKRAKAHSFLRPHPDGDGWQAGMYDDQRKMHTGRGPTPQHAVNDVMREAADSQGLKWWPTAPGGKRRKG